MTAPELIAGRYRLIRRLATGGMGSVWEAWDELLRRRVAVKQLLLQPSMSTQDAELARSRVIREARITARLHHPHAVALYDVVDHHGQPCLIMQYVPARNLNQLLQERGALDEPVVARIGAEVASALAAAHEVGILHRDVKPSNVLITADGSAKLTDFGISHAAGDVSLTSTGMITGTPAFLAPEVARGEKSGFPADVFSLGATMYAALEGTPPFGTDENPMALLHKVGSGRISPPRSSGALTAIVLRMLAIEPAARPSMAQVSRALSAGPAPGTLELPAAEGMTVGLPPHTIRDWPADHGQATAAGAAALEAARPAQSPGPVPVPETGRRRPVAVLLAVGAVLAVVAVVSGYLVFTGGNSHRPTDSAEPASGAPAASSVAFPSIAGSAQTRGSSAPGPVIPETTVASASRVARRPGSSSAKGAPAPGTITDAAPSSLAAATSATVRAAPAGTPTSRSASPKTSSTRAASSRTTTSTPAAPSSGADQVSPTMAELAGAITDYYALMPSGENEGWDRLTANFQSTTAQNRQYYQRFWSGVSRVTAQDVQGTTPNKAQATITYYFDDGRVAVERTAYTLVQEEGALKIDTSTVLSSDSG